MELTKRKLLVGTGGVLGISLLSLPNSSNKELTVLTIAKQSTQYTFGLTTKRPVSVYRHAVKINPSDINQDAGTRFENSIIVSNNSQTLLDFYVRPSTVDTEELDFQIDGSSIVDESNSISIEPGQTATLTLLIDLTDTNSDALQTAPATLVATESV